MDVQKPDYYINNNIEVKDVIKAFTENLEGVKAFYAGNIIKYACRWNKKNGVEDLKKLMRYASLLIDELDGEIFTERGTLK